ncbi:Ulp1 protease family [Theobroma cacao]|nr:Ulp1 protease family [Theobroma cacao]
MVLYHQSTPDVVETQSSSPKLFTVHHGATEISDQTKRAQLKMASKYMASSYVGPLVSRGDVKDTIVEAYEAFKKYESVRSTYGKNWEDVDFILAPCNVGGHWVVARIDLVRWTIKVMDSARTSDAKDNGVRAAQMTPLMTMMPIIYNQAGYFNNKC